MHIFISYAKKDTRALTQDLAQRLASLPDVNVWWDKTIRPGDSWARQIQDEIIRADLIIVLLSPDVNRAPTSRGQGSFVLKEINYALDKEKLLLPVMVEATDIPIQIADLQYIDFTLNQEAGIQQLLDYVHGLRGASPSSPILKKPITSTKPKISRRTLLTSLGVGILVIAVIMLVIVLGMLNDAPDKSEDNELSAENLTATATYRDSYTVNLLYNASSFYLVNSGKKTLSGIGAIRFESVDDSGNVTGQIFQGNLWSRFFRDILPSYCDAIEATGSNNLLRPDDCHGFNATSTVSSDDDTLFWLDTNNTIEFSVLWNGEEVGRCPVYTDTAQACEINLPLAVTSPSTPSTTATPTIRVAPSLTPVVPTPENVSDSEASSAYADGVYPLLFLYDETGFYLLNTNSKRLETIDLGFVAIDEFGNSTGRELFREDIDWGEKRATIDGKGGGCHAIELANLDNWLRPDNCREPDEIFALSDENSSYVFWLSTDNALEFSVLWEGLEIGRCPVYTDTVQECTVYLPQEAG